MDPILQILLNWQFIAFGLAISAIMFIIRQILEYLMETYTGLDKESKVWNDLILPILPIGLGAFAAWWITSFPYPNGLTSTWSRVIWGLGAGLLSGLMYRVLKALLFQKAGISLPDNDGPLTPPPQPPPPPPMSANLPPRGSL